MTFAHRSLSVFALVAAVAATAHAYDGVQPETTERTRDDVAREAIEATALHDPYRDSASSGVIAPMRVSVDRAAVQREAVLAAHAPHQNLEPGAFFNSVIPRQFDMAPPATRLATGSSSATDAH